MYLIEKYLGESKIDPKQKKIITQFKKEVKSIQRLKYKDIEGLVDPDEDPDLALDAWQENQETNVFDEYSRKLGITFDQLVAWWRINIDRPMPDRVRKMR